MPRIRDALNKFVSAAVSEIEEANDRLADLDRQIYEHEGLLAEVSLHAVKAGLGEEEVAIYRTSNAKLQELIGLRGACLRWISELNAAERDRQREVDIRAKKSRHSAFIQHARAFDKLEAAFAKNLAAVIDDWKELHAQGQKVLKLVNPMDQYNEGAYRRFQHVGIRHNVSRELCRQGLMGQNLTDYTGPQSFPGVQELRSTALGAMGIEDLTYEMRGITVEGKEQSDWAIRQFAVSLGLGTSDTDDTPDSSRVIPIARPLSTPEAPPPVILVGDRDGSYERPLADAPPPQQLSPSRPQEVPRSEGFVFSKGQSQVAPDRPPVSDAKLEANANKTLHSLVSASIPVSTPTAQEIAAEETAKATKGAPINPHPPGTGGWEETERVLARMSNPARKAFDDAAKRASEEIPNPEEDEASE